MIASEDEISKGLELNRKPTLGLQKSFNKIEDMGIVRVQSM